jgi:hypothetical protein
MEEAEGGATVSAEAVLAAFAAAGLTITNPRDNSDNGSCAADFYACSEYFTTEEAAIVTFPSNEVAAETKAMLVGKGLDSTWVFSSGPAALNFNGRDTTPDNQVLYSAELEKLVAGE